MPNDVELRQLPAADFIARKDGEPIAFGGVWEECRSPDGEMLPTFATMTTEANPELALIQDRMPGDHRAGRLAGMARRE